MSFCERPHTPLMPREIIRNVASKLVRKGLINQEQAEVQRPSYEEIAKRVQATEGFISELIEAKHARIEGNKIFLEGGELI